MKHWYVVRESHSPSLREGDIIGFGKQNPNLTTIQDGRFVPSADWIYIGRWDVPPVDDLIEAIKLIQAKDARIKELDGMLDARSKEIVGRIQECQACQIDQLRADGKIGISEAPGRQEEAELSTSREVKRLEARNEALLKIGRKPLEDCHRIQQTLRDRLDRIHGYLFDHNAPWKNGDGTDDIAIAYMNRQATRIQELEDALAEERAKRNVAGHGDCFYRTPSRTDPLVWKCDKGVICDWNCCPIKNEKRIDALQELQAEGKIGPDAALKKQWDDVLGTTRRSWQITEERKAAIQHILVCHHCRYGDSGCKAPDVLRDMLDEHR